MSSSGSITSQKGGVVWNQSRKVCVIEDIETVLIPYTRPALNSQSVSTSHLLPSSPDLGVPLYCWLIPSMMFVTPGTCQMSTMLCASTPSLHLACIADSLSFFSTSQRAWQLVSTSTGYPYTISENLSNENFSAANSSRKGLYFFLDTNILLEVRVIGCRCVTSFPPGRVDLILCARMPVKASLHPSVVKMNGVPSYTGAGRTGSKMSQALRAMDVFMCSGVYRSLSLKALIICWYLCFLVPAGIGT